jgi:hypothetical protein
MSSMTWLTCRSRESSPPLTSLLAVFLSPQVGKASPSLFISTALTISLKIEPRLSLAGPCAETNASKVSCGTRPSERMFQCGRSSDHRRYPNEFLLHGGRRRPNYDDCAVA